LAERVELMLAEPSSAEIGFAVESELEEEFYVSRDLSSQRDVH